MTVAIFIFCVLWIIGWVRELAITSRGMRRAGMEYPSKSIKNGMPIFLFFTWPYFYFYGKL